MWWITALRISPTGLLKSMKRVTPGIASSVSGSLMSARTTVVDGVVGEQRPAVQVRRSGRCPRTPHRTAGSAACAISCVFCTVGKPDPRSRNCGDALSRHEPHRAAERRPVQPRPAAAIPIALTASAATSRSAREVVLAAEDGVVDPRHAWLGRVDIGRHIRRVDLSPRHAVVPRHRPSPAFPADTAIDPRYRSDNRWALYPLP